MKASNLPRFTVFRSTILPCFSDPTRLKLVFAKSIPIVVIFMRTSPIVKWLCGNSTVAHRDAGKIGGVHLIR